MGIEKCFILTCQRQGSKGYFKFPLNNPALMEKWFESLAISNIPSNNTRVCWRHFHSSDLHGTSKKVEKAPGKNISKMILCQIFCKK